MHLVEGARLGLEEEAVEAAVQRAKVSGAPRRFPRRAGAVRVVVLDEEAAGEAGAVIRAAAAAHGVPLEGAQGGRRLPRVEKDGLRALQRVDVRAGHRRDAGEPLDEVEGRALGREHGDRRPLDLGEDGARLHEVAVRDAERDARGRGEEGEETGQERGSRNDGALAADHLRGHARGRSEDRERRDVLALLGERARQEVVEGGREGSSGGSSRARRILDEGTRLPDPLFRSIIRRLRRHLSRRNS